MTTRKRSIAKNTAVEQRIVAAMDNLEAAWIAGEGAVAARSKDAKALTTTVKRLSKRHASLNKRKKTANARVKKSPNAETRAALRTVTKDLATTKRELEKARTAKAANAEELKALKDSFRRANAFYVAIEKAQSQLEKPNRRRRR
ncbi:MAG: hypothetical protein KDA27_17575 [Candidatus Eisenbacteria bacterium]|uniref:Uncharacterized protein n=1 Tax=Eiseniibacteriota bacterium TaxID=2212470 RepID=A0A956NHX7_UNCEI|nr:hypothetical protein [Candidatus Eisenbacteria bacterium]